MDDRKPDDGQKPRTDTRTLKIGCLVRKRTDTLQVEPIGYRRTLSTRVQRGNRKRSAGRSVR
mgnify:CR=1 FL=1